jgi:hypothetical protein
LASELTVSMPGFEKGSPAHTHPFLVELSGFSDQFRLPRRDHRRVYVRFRSPKG